jgi:hypothetical protein
MAGAGVATRGVRLGALREVGFRAALISREAIKKKMRTTRPDIRSRIDRRVARARGAL